MTIQSCFQNSQRTSNVPERLVLDTSQAFKKFMQRLYDLSGLQWDNVEVVDMMLQSLTYQDKALMELSYSCMDIVKQTLGGAFEHQAEQLASAVHELGQHLFDQLCTIRAYQQGYLFYQYYDCVGWDIVLIRLNVPKDPEKMPPHD